MNWTIKRVRGDKQRRGGERSQQRPTALQSTPTMLPARPPIHTVKMFPFSICWHHRETTVQTSRCAQAAGGRTANQRDVFHKPKPPLRNGKKKNKNNNNLVILRFPQLLFEIYKGEIMPVFIENCKWEWKEIKASLKFLNRSLETVSSGKKSWFPPSGYVHTRWTEKIQHISVEQPTSCHSDRDITI